MGPETIPREGPLGEDGGGVGSAAIDNKDNFRASHNLKNFGMS